MTVRAMALAAGKGTGLFPLPGEIPKLMGRAGGTPIGRHPFDLLARYYATKVCGPNFL